MDALTRLEFNQAVRDVLFSSQMLGDRTFELIENYATGHPQRGIEFLCAEFLLHRSKGATARSFVYITGHNKKFIKLCVTLRTADPRDATARNFADTVAALLKQQEGGADTPWQHLMSKIR
jgi:hypothetical protein